MSTDSLDRTTYEFMAHDQHLLARHKADSRDQPDGLYHGQSIIGYREWMGGTLHVPGHWHTIVVLADGSRIEIDEEH